MDFIATVRSQCDKLKKHTVVNVLYKEMVEGKRETVDTDTMYDYRFHFPIDMEQYFVNLLDKLKATEDFNYEGIDNYLKAYLLTMLYFCTNVDGPHFPLSESLLASEVYLELINLSKGHYFFNQSLYSNIIKVINCAVLKHEVRSPLQIMERLFQYISKNEEPPDAVLTPTIGVYCVFITVHTNQKIGCFDTGTTFDVIGFNYVKQIIEKTNNERSCFLIFKRLLQSLRDPTFSIEQRKFLLCNLLRFWQANKFAPIVHEALSKGLEDLWIQTDFDLYQEAVKLINVFELPYYQDVIRNLGLYMQSSNHTIYLTNMFQLLFHLLNEPNANYQKKEKIEVFYDVAIRNTFLQILSKSAKTRDEALDVLAKICAIRSTLVSSIFTKISTCDNEAFTINLDSILNAILNIIDNTVFNSNRHRNLTTILVVLLTSTNEIDLKIASHILYALCWNSKPSTLIQSLQMLHELFLQMIIKRQKQLSHCILNIFLRMSMHEDAASKDFLSHLYNSMLRNATLNGVDYPPKYYCDALMDEQFDEMHTKFFNKCKSAGLVSVITMQHLMNHLNYDDTGNLKLIHTLLKFVDYRNLGAISSYLETNLSFPLVYQENSKYLFEILNEILTRTLVVTQEDFPTLDCIYSHLSDNLINQLFPVTVFKSAYKACLKLRDVLKISHVTEILNAMRINYDTRMLSTLDQFDDISPIAYYTELMLEVNELPSELIMTKLNAIMTNPARRKEIQERHTVFWIPLLILYADIAFIKRSHAIPATEVLSESLNSNNDFIKISAMKLLLSICKEVTYDYKELAVFAFKDVIHENIGLNKLCIGAIEELIHMDYLKLSAQQFFLFVYLLGHPETEDFMRELLGKRFILTNQSAVVQYFVNIMFYCNQYTNHSIYSISDEFEHTLAKIIDRILFPKRIFEFLFDTVSIAMKLNILGQATSIFDDMRKNHVRINDNYMKLTEHAIYLFELINPSREQHISNVEEFSETTMVLIKDRILESNTQPPDPVKMFPDHESQIRQLTFSVLDFLKFSATDVKLQHLFKLCLQSTLLFVDYFKEDLAYYSIIERQKDIKRAFQNMVVLLEHHSKLI